MESHCNERLHGAMQGQGGNSAGNVEYFTTGVQ
jgi:hypothetical protein